MKLKPAMNKLFPGFPTPLLRFCTGDQPLRPAGELRRSRLLPRCLLGDDPLLGDPLLPGDRSRRGDLLGDRRRPAGDRVLLDGAPGDGDLRGIGDLLRERPL